MNNRARALEGMNRLHRQIRDEGEGGGDSPRPLFAGATCYRATLVAHVAVLGTFLASVVLGSILV
jgi:hypothetical protein